MSRPSRNSGAARGGIGLRAVGDDLVPRHDRGDRDVGLRQDLGIERREIGFDRRAQQLVEAGDHEIVLLEIVDAIFGAHHAGKIEADAIGAVAFEREAAFGLARHDTRAIDAQAIGFLDQPEFDRVPVKA